MKEYFINNPDTLYQQYSKIVEQAAVIADDPKERIAQYLDNEDLLEKLAVEFRIMEPGTTTTLEELQISGEDYGILKDDVVHVHKYEEDGVPKFHMWIMNEKVMYGGIDWDNAAFLLNKASEYAPAGKVLGTIGNYIGSVFGYGDPGDAGTDEEGLIGVAGALTQIASERKLDPKLYFDRLAETYASKYGESLEDMLTTEFSGRAEAVALNMFRQPIEPSAARGFNLGSFLLDVGLTVATFGAGTIAKTAAPAAARATAKLAQAGNVASKTTKLGKAGAGIAKVGSKLLTGMRGVISRVPGWRVLTKGQQAKYLGQHLRIGQQFKYSASTGNKFLCTFKGFKDGRVLVTYDKAIKGGKAVATPTSRLGATTAVDSSKFLLGIEPTLANKILDTAGLAATAAALEVADANLSKYDGGESGYNSGFFATAGEVMGWYDGVSADPNEFLANLQLSDETALAEMLVQLKEGSGFFGNTTNQEELQIALIITSLTPENARKVQSEYLKKGGETVYALLDDELGGDMGMMAKAYWASCTGDGIKSVPYVSKSLAQIKTGK